jgi:hypothetical protein
VKEVVLEIETKTNQKVQVLRSDNEFRTYSLHKFCKSSGRVQQFTVSHSPAQNGTAERAIGTTMEVVRKVLFGSGMPMSFWTQAAQYATFILNSTPTTSVEEGIPYQLYQGKEPRTQFSLPFGAKVFGFVSAAHRVNQSLGARAIQARYLGPSLDQKGFRLWIPSKGKIFITRHCVQANKDGIITESYDAEDFGIIPEGNEKPEVAVLDHGEDNLVQSQVKVVQIQEEKQSNSRHSLNCQGVGPRLAIQDLLISRWMLNWMPLV